MMQTNRLLRASILLVRVFRIVNGVAVAFFIAALIATLPGAELIEARLARKYGSSVDTASIIVFVQVTMLLALPVGYAIERLLIALRAVLRTVGTANPSRSPTRHACGRSAGCCLSCSSPTWLLAS